MVGEREHREPKSKVNDDMSERERETEERKRGSRTEIHTRIETEREHKGTVRRKEGRNVGEKRCKISHTRANAHTLA